MPRFPAQRGRRTLRSTPEQCDIAALGRGRVGWVLGCDVRASRTRRGARARVLISGFVSGRPLTKLAIMPRTVSGLPDSADLDRRFGTVDLAQRGSWFPNGNLARLCPNPGSEFTQPRPRFRRASTQDAM